MWVATTGTPGAVNVDRAERAEALSSVPGNVRFYLPGGTVDVAMGSTQADAEAAVHRLVDAVDPADYS